MPSEKPLLLVAAIVLIDAGSHVLLARRPPGKPLAGLWEFPGGKIKPGETPEQALSREMQEELGIIVMATDLTPLTFASYAYPAFHLLMPLFACRVWQGRPKPEEGQKLAWVLPQDLQNYPMPPADQPLPALIEKLLRP
jgi:8-oxo-dGTP diphosphatase